MTPAPTSSDFDVVVIGGGPGGERAAIVAPARRQVVVVERANVIGGTRVNWGTIPSKTLRESALFVDSLTRHRLHGIHCQMADEITVADFMYRERVVVQHELELINATLGKLPGGRRPGARAVRRQSPRRGPRGGRDGQHRDLGGRDRGGCGDLTQPPRGRAV